MQKIKWILVLCAAAVLMGCGRAATESAPARQTPEAAVVKMEAGQTNAGQATSPEEGEGGIAYTHVDSNARADASGADVAITGGCVEITVDRRAFAHNIEVAEGASVRLILKNGAAFTGAVHSSSVQDVYVSLDADSTWTLTEDTAVGGLVNADASFANVQSAGFSLQYDSEYADNAYLAAAAKQLPGGGFLTPII